VKDKDVNGDEMNVELGAWYHEIYTKINGVL
jgi:hypothetical protein